MKNLRRYYWLITEFSKRHHKVIFRTIGIVLALSLLATFFVRYVPSTRTLTRLGLVGKYTLETLPLVIQNQLSLGLVTMVDGEPLAALAQDWEVLDDGKTYTFYLDQEKRWSDGTKVVGEDINYNFKDVEITRSLDTVTFKLSDPFAPFFYAVSKPILKDNKYGVSNYTLDKTVVSSSVLQQVTLVSDSEMLIYKFYPTESSAITAFKLGEVDKLENLSVIPADLEQDPRVALQVNDNAGKIAVLFFNNNDAELTSKSTRQALAYAIRDKSFGRERALSPISEDSWAYNPLVKDYEHDQEKARTLLTQDASDVANVKLELKTTLQYLEIAETIATDWRDNLGIQVDVKVVTTIGSDYQVLLADYTPPPDPDQYTVWHSTQAGNFTRYTNLKVDKLLEDGRRTSDKKLRRDIYQDFQRFLLEDCPAVFLFNTSSYNLSRKPLFN